MSSIKKNTSKHGIWPHILREKIYLPLLSVEWLVFANAFFHNNVIAELCTSIDAGGRAS